MNKKELEQQVLQLTQQVEASKTVSESYEAELRTAQTTLADASKLGLTQNQFDDILEAVEQGVSEFDFDSSDNYDIEYGIDYDCRIHCSSHEFRNLDDLVQNVFDRVSQLFATLENREDNA